ncbi:hypothetical protein PsorP6_001567 [Peronosclerospora sorghi]|uniref:Uncharacterized protein n=1 Tax=Peronosclerospora sorghi TaxID=230839 RepID=A0ACC0WPV9_9STRA|nr:hypothetical protein PsorP6_001567 [Peronosclerospora sorghi]
MTLVYLFETYLDYRQYRKLQDKQFPPPLKQAIEALGADDDDDKTGHTTLLAATQAKFDTSRAYGVDRSVFGLVKAAYTQVEATALLVLGYWPLLWTVSGRILVSMGLDPTNEISRALLLVTLTSVREMLVGLPFDVYATFVLEARHGFNQQTFRLFIMDKLKQWMLLLVLGYPVLSVLLCVIRWGGPSFYMYGWAFLFVISLLLITVYPVAILPLFNTFTPLAQGTLRSRIEALAAEVAFPLANIFVTDGSKRSRHSNAYLIGLFRTKRIVLYDTLVDQATEDEIVAIVGHELGHWRLGHVLEAFGIQQATILAYLYAFGWCMQNRELFCSFGFAGDVATPVMIGGLLFSQTLWAPVDHVLTFLGTLATRRNEFAADAFAVDLGHERALQSGLTKLAIENLANMNPDALYSTYHYSHPPLLERLDAIAARGKKVR